MINALIDLVIGINALTGLVVGVVIGVALGIPIGRRRERVRHVREQWHGAPDVLKAQSWSRDE